MVLFKDIKKVDSKRRVIISSKIIKYLNYLDNKDFEIKVDKQNRIQLSNKYEIGSYVVICLYDSGLFSIHSLDELVNEGYMDKKVKEVFND
jgi:mRNA-degrading endonuclease RelE of RelBE toxin-antitoxin system